MGRISGFGRKEKRPHFRERAQLGELESRCLPARETRAHSFKEARKEALPFWLLLALSQGFLKLAPQNA